jgi:tetratricopeptide (TPR) repeat protein
LRALLQQLERSAPERGAQAVTRDAGVDAALRSLGYLSGASAPSAPRRAGGIDPKDGIALLDEFERAKAALREGRAAEAMTRLEELVRRNPGNVPFLSRLAEAQALSGRREAALATLREAVHWNPTQDLLRVRLADAYFELGQVAEARAEYETTLALNPHAARAWMGLGELALRQGRPQEELSLMRRALAAGVESALVLSRLAQIEAGRGELAAAEEHAREATRLLPEFALGWWVWGETAEKRGQPAEAVKRYARAVEQGLATAPALLQLGRVLQQLGRTAEARVYLAQASRAGGAAGTEARRLLESRP